MRLARVVSLFDWSAPLKRHCEERSDVAIHQAFARRLRLAKEPQTQAFAWDSGSPRFARDDEVYVCDSV